MDQNKQERPKIEFRDKEQILSMLRGLLLDQESLYDENILRLEKQHLSEMKQLELRLEDIKTERIKSELEFKKFNKVVLAMTFGVISILVSLIIALTVLLYGTTFVIENGSNSVLNNNSVGYIGGDCGYSDYLEEDTGFKNAEFVDSFE